MTELTLKPSVLPLRLWTVAEYHRMAELGLPEPEEQVELVTGQIIRKIAPQRTTHAVTITLIHHLYNRILGDQVLIRTQLPIALSERSEPEPDIALVISGELRYLASHPHPEEIYLILEVADTTLRVDCDLKATTYAQAGIEDYWVVDLKSRELRVFRQPTPEGYGSITVFSGLDRLALLQFPDISINIRELMPPVNQ